MRRRFRHVRARVPLPLAAVVGVGVVLTLAWTTLQPPWNGPDEPGHFAYVQRMVEQREIPWYAGGAPENEPHGASSEVGIALGQTGALARDFNYAMKDANRAPDERIWNEIEAKLVDGQRKNTDFMATMLNPPGYPLYQAVPYLATSSQDIHTRVWTLRLWNLPLVIATIVSAWVFTGLLVGPRRLLQTLAAGIVAVNAQLVMVGGSVNADSLLTALYSVAFVLMGLVLLRGPTKGRVAALTAVTVATGLTHGRGLALLLPVALTAAILLWRRYRPHGAAARVGGTLAVLAGAAVSALVVLRTATGRAFDIDRAREFGSYMWQFYLPRPDWMKPFINNHWGVRDVFVDRFWATNPTLDATLEPWIADLMSKLSLAGVLIFLAVLAVRWRTTRRVAALTVVLAVAFVTYLLVLHVAGYRSMIGGAGDPVITGRYLAPFVVLLGAAVAVTVSRLPRRVLPVVATVVLFGAFSLQLAMLGAVMVRFHG